MTLLASRREMGRPRQKAARGSRDRIGRPAADRGDFFTGTCGFGEHGGQRQDPNPPAARRNMARRVKRIPSPNPDGFRSWLLSSMRAPGAADKGSG